jgi:hypothetical protein
LNRKHDQLPPPRRILTTCEHARQVTTLSADTTAAPVRIVLISLADGRTEGMPVGHYLASCDPEAADGNSAASWTSDPDQAMTLATADDAVAC